MEFRVEKERMEESLQKIQGITSKGNLMPVLSSVLLTAKNEDMVEIVATDLEVGIKDSFSAVVADEGAVAVDSRRLYLLIKGMPQGETLNITLKENNQLEVRGGKAVYTLQALSAEEFPSMAGLNEEVKAETEIESAVLRSLIEKTSYAITHDNNRFQFNGAYLESIPDGGGLVMVATDGCRLAYKEVGVDLEFPNGNGIMISTKGLSEFKRFAMSRNGNPMKMKITESCVILREGDSIVTARIVDSKFPNYRQIIPDEGSMSRIVIDMNSLLAALKRITVLSDKNKASRVEFSFTPESLTLNIDGFDLGSGNEVLEVEGSETLKVSFNAHFLIDAIEASDGEEVVFLINDPNKPAVVRSKEDNSSCCVVMPMR